MSLSERIKLISYLKARRQRMRESVAVLKMLALGNRQIEAGQVRLAAEVIARLRERWRAD